MRLYVLISSVRYSSSHLLWYSKNVHLEYILMYIHIFCWYVLLFMIAVCQRIQWEAPTRFINTRQAFHYPCGPASYIYKIFREGPPTTMFSSLQATEYIDNIVAMATQTFVSDMQVINTNGSGGGQQASAVTNLVTVQPASQQQQQQQSTSPQVTCLYICVYVYVQASDSSYVFSCPLACIPVLRPVSRLLLCLRSNCK